MGNRIYRLRTSVHDRRGRGTKEQTGRSTRRIFVYTEVKSTFSIEIRDDPVCDVIRVTLTVRIAKLSHDAVTQPHLSWCNHLSLATWPRFSIDPGDIAIQYRYDFDIRRYRVVVTARKCAIRSHFRRRSSRRTSLWPLNTKKSKNSKIIVQETNDFSPRSRSRYEFCRWKSHASLCKDLYGEIGLYREIYRGNLIYPSEGSTKTQKSEGTTATIRLVIGCHFFLATFRSFVTDYVSLYSVQTSLRKCSSRLFERKQRGKDDRRSKQASLRGRMLTRKRCYLALQNERD